MKTSALTETLITNCTGEFGPEVPSLCFSFLIFNSNDYHANSYYCHSLRNYEVMELYLGLRSFPLITP